MGQVALTRLFQRPTSVGAVAPRKANLREAQKAFTRQRILDAARDLFYRQGYYGTTVDQIVSAAGASRPTFYLHFSDKEEIVTELVASYASRAAAQLERLPGPLPTLEEVRAWLLDMARFMEQEKVTLSTLGEVSAHAISMPDYVRATLDVSMAALSRRAPAFAAAQRDDAIGIEARARADLFMIEVTYAATLYWKKKGPLGEASIAHVAKSLHAFLHDPRYRQRKRRAQRKS
jgi:AcrR family transcriptional regulator